MSFGIVIVAILPGIIINVIPRNIQKELFTSLSAIDGKLALVVIFAAFFFLDCVLLAIAFSRFNRNRLIGE